MNFLKTNKYLNNIKLSFAALISVVFLFIFSNYLYKMSIFKLGIGEHLEKQQSNYSEGPTYSQRYNSTNNENSDIPWDYKNETYSDYLKKLTTSTNIPEDYEPNSFTNSKLSLYDANILVYSDKYVKDVFPEQVNDGINNRSHWYNPIVSGVHYGPDYVDNNSQTFGYEKWKDNFLPPKLEESLAVELSDPTYTNAKIIISSTNSFENIKSVNIVNNTNKQSFDSNTIDTWRDDEANIPDNLRVTQAVYRGSNSKTIFGFEWENPNDSSYDGYYEFRGAHNPYDHGGYNGGHYSLKGPERVDGYNVEVDNKKIIFDNKNKEYSIPIKWNIEMNNQNDFNYQMTKMSEIIFGTTIHDFPWVNRNNEWVKHSNITENNRSLILSSMYYGYGLDKNLSIIDNTNLLRTLSFFTSPGDIDTNTSDPGVGVDGVLMTGSNDNDIFTSHLDNKYFIGNKGKVDTRYYQPAYKDSNNKDHYLKSPFIYRFDKYFTKLLPWVDAYTINDKGEYDLVDSQQVFDPNRVVWKMKKMPEDDGPIIEVDFNIVIQNDHFMGMQKDNLILDIVNYSPYIHKDGGYYNTFIISSNNIIVSVKPTSSKYFFDYYLDHTNMSVMLMNDLKYKFKFKMFVSESEYPNLKDKEIEYYTNNNQHNSKSIHKKVSDFVKIGDVNTYVEVEFTLDNLKPLDNVESIAFVVKDFPPAAFPSFNPVVSFGTNLVMKDINLRRDPDTKQLIIMFIFNANFSINEKYYYWGSELITHNSLTSSTRMEVEGSNNSSYQIKDGINVVNVSIDETYISNIVDLKDNFIFGYSDSLDDHPTQDKTFKVYNEDLQDIVIPKAGKSSSQKLIEKIIILTSVVAFFIISAFSSGIVLLIRSNKQTRMVINSLDDEIFNSDDMEEDFELSL